MLLTRKNPIWTFQPRKVNNNEEIRTERTNQRVYQGRKKQKNAS